MMFGFPRGTAQLNSTTLTMAGRPFTLKTVTGELLDADRREETKLTVSQSGGGGTMIGGTGYVAPTRTTIEQETTVFDTVYLRDDAGKEHVVELEDFHLQARPSHRLSLVASSSREGDEFLVYNHTTEKQYTGTKAIRSMLAPGVLWVLANAALVALASAIPLSMLNHGEGFLSGVVTALLGTWMIGFSQFVSRARASRFVGGRVWKQLVQQVAGSP